MRKIAVLSAAALIGAGLLAPSAAEARGGGALAAGLIGGLAAGVLLGAAVSDAQSRPAYGYPAPAYDEAPPPVVYRPTGYGYGYRGDYARGPVYEVRRPVSYGYGDDAGYRGWHRHHGRPYGYGGW